MLRRLFVLAIALGVVLVGSQALAGSRAPGSQSAAGSKSAAGKAAWADSMDTVAAPLISILCYHDFSDRGDVPPYTVPADTLRAHIRRLKAAGFRFLSLSELLSYRDRPAKLPGRVVVLTFDDGYRSFIEQALPILKKERVKAALAIVSSFIDAPPRGLPAIMTWEQIRRAEASGWVEIISHSNALHRYETANSYGDRGPSVATRRYLVDGRYETRDEYEERVQSDMRASQRVLASELGHPVKVLAWPYGEYTTRARGIATEAGFPVTLALGGTRVTVEDLRSGCLPRVMVFRDMAIGGADFEWLFPTRVPMSAAEVDLDDLYVPEPERFRDNLEKVVGRAKRIGATDVFLSGCPDLSGDGSTDETYFMNHRLPIRADIWSRVAYECSYAGLKVWMRAPSMNLSWEWKRHPDWRIPFFPERQKNDRTPPSYRVSPDLAGVRQAAVDFYNDIAVYLPIEGMVFGEDATMLAGECLAGAAATSPAAKAEAIEGLLGGVRAAVRAWRPYCKFGRMIYAGAAQTDGVHPDYAQNLERTLREYDLVVVLAHARREGHAKDAKDWVKSLARLAAQGSRPRASGEHKLRPVMLAFQAYDWAEREWVSARELTTLVKTARREGIQDLGVYPLAPDAGQIPDRLLEGGGTRAHPSAAAD